MNFNKLASSALLLLVSILSIAQEERPGRFPSGDNEDLADGFGGPGAPIDNYAILLIMVAVSMIAFVAYKRFQAKQA